MTPSGESVPERGGCSEQKTRAALGPVLLAPVRLWTASLTEKLNRFI